MCVYVCVCVKRSLLYNASCTLQRKYEYRILGVNSSLMPHTPNNLQHIQTADYIT